MTVMHQGVDSRSGSGVPSVDDVRARGAETAFNLATAMTSPLPETGETTSAKVRALTLSSAEIEATCFVADPEMTSSAAAPAPTTSLATSATARCAVVVLPTLLRANQGATS